MKRHIIVFGIMFAMLVGLASMAMAQVPPEGCYLAPDGETFIDEVTGEVCVLDEEDERDDDDAVTPPTVEPAPEALAETGATVPVGGVLASGLGLLVIGGGALTLSRRRGTSA